MKMSIIKDEKNENMVLIPGKTPNSFPLCFGLIGELHSLGKCDTLTCLPQRGSHIQSPKHNSHLIFLLGIS